MIFLTLHRPLGMLMLLPILISIHMTSIAYVRIVGVISILLFSIGNIWLSQNEYIELWTISIYLIFFLVIRAKNLIKKSEESGSKDITDIDSIYNKDFFNDFNYEEFTDIFMKNCTVKKFTKKKKLFSSEGGPFDKVYYFVNIPKSCLVTLKHQKVVISYLKQSSWIGVVEFISQLFDDAQRKWIVGMEIDNPAEEEVVWLEWDKDSFHRIFKKHKSSSFLKRLLTCWIKYLALSTYKMDDHIASALGVITHKRFDQFADVLPLFRHMSIIQNDEAEEHLIKSADEKDLA